MCALEINKKGTYCVNVQHNSLRVPTSHVLEVKYIVCVYSKYVARFDIILFCFTQ